MLRAARLCQLSAILCILFGQVLCTTFTVTGDQTDTLDGDYFLTGNSSVFSAYSSIVFDNNSGATRNVTMDGDNFTVWCAPATGTQTIQKTGTDDVVLTIINCRLKNFDPIFAQTNSSGLTVQLGNNCEIIHESDITPSRSETLNVVGDAVINCNGNTFTNATGAGHVDIVNGSASLKIKNGTFKSTTSDFAGSSSGGGTLCFENIRIINDATNLELDYQSATDFVDIEISGLVAISGKHPTTIGSDYNFKLRSRGTFTILSDSMLTVERGNNFSYEVDPGGDAEVISDIKRHFLMTDLSSRFFLDGCTLTSTDTGMAIDKGNLIVDGKVNFNISTNALNQAELGSALVVDIKPSATLKLNGPVDYITTTP